MQPCEIFATSGLHFADAEQALVHIGQEMLAQGVVHPGYPAALLAREAEFPTGIALDKHAVAIPHCSAEHARRPALYLIRPAQPVPFQQADDESTLTVSLIIALIVTDPQQQLVLLRTLFGQLQEPDFLDALLAAPDEALGELFRRRLFSLPSSPTSQHQQQQGVLP
ncbi:PTS galactitol transporter subunit IIA [Chimaeribacter arupi]|uniref:PTS galactitol transporter subunit IIA n=2 Tax=Yersiniaceae TaxID=1903411 RepID=A0A2N5EQF1_9GAMM|nr:MULTISPECIES: PTS galactitol transporter subunit IIA [Yersiniaceae]MBS0968353.1 PTS galactitol transporter subunit IIA [Nissabacter archeti]PLR38147.1 PTS galactitol transporter subunit IIA [Chimaeribacter arupi]PLR46332.1 PTS galactitol transporter subunit IIA [Chimaeribacter arupi]PLR51828.1 PTS galactitol transporter subunit IIA [Chimaeribacter arupi]PLR54294.1 PTS galactitol transporter subunit IIA [Chimaeribacter arupi]